LELMLRGQNQSGILNTVVERETVLVIRPAEGDATFWLGLASKRFLVNPIGTVPIIWLDYRARVGSAYLYEQLPGIESIPGGSVVGKVVIDKATTPSHWLVPSAVYRLCEKYIFDSDLEAAKYVNLERLPKKGKPKKIIKKKITFDEDDDQELVLERKGEKEREKPQKEKPQKEKSQKEKPQKEKPQKENPQKENPRKDGKGEGGQKGKESQEEKKQHDQMAQDEERKRKRSSSVTTTLQQGPRKKRKQNESPSVEPPKEKEKRGRRGRRKKEEEKKGEEEGATKVGEVLLEVAKEGVEREENVKDKEQVDTESPPSVTQIILNLFAEELFKISEEEPNLNLKELVSRGMLNFHKNIKRPETFKEAVSLQAKLESEFGTSQNSLKPPKRPSTLFSSTPSPRHFPSPSLSPSPPPSPSSLPPPSPTLSLSPVLSVSPPLSPGSSVSSPLVHWASEELDSTALPSLPLSPRVVSETLPLDFPSANGSIMCSDSEDEV